MEFTPRSRPSRIVISVFIIFTVFAVVLTNNSKFDGTSAATRPVMTVFNSYARLTRLMQRWALFTPEPRRYVVQYEFRIRFRDQTSITWSRPTPPKFEFFARYYAADWQKFDTAANHMENPALWPDMAAWVARKYSNPRNPPIEIQLVARIAPTPPPRSNGNAWPAADEFHFREQPIFTYEVATGQIDAQNSGRGAMSNDSGASQ